MVFWLAMAVWGAVDGDSIVDTARGYLGYPYVYGDEGTYGFDCSGFVQSVYAIHGLRLPRTARLQSKVGEPVELDALRAGDLVLFTPSPTSNRISHVGIATGDGRVIHASSGRGEVVVDPVAGYWTNHGAEGRRVIGTPFEALGDMGPEPEREHVGPMPVSFGSSATPALWHHGLVDLSRGSTAFGLKSGVATSPSRESVLWITPRLELRWDARDAEIGLQLPLAYSADGESRFEYGRTSDALRVLDRVRFGTPEAAVYLEASRDVSLSLGPESLVRGVTPNATTRSVAGLPSRGALAARTHATFERWKTGFVIDDVLAPALIGFRLERLGSLDLGAELTGDPNASGDGRLTAGTTAGLNVVDRRAFGLRLHGAGSVFGTTRPAPLLAAGFSVRISPSPVEIQVAGEWRRFQHGAAPDLFGVDYRALSTAGIWDQLDRESRNSGWQNGYRLEALAALTRRFALRGALSIAGDDDGLGQDQLELGLIAREWQLTPNLVGALALGYHQRFVRTLVAPDFERSGDLAFANARVRHRSGFSLGAQIARRPIDDAPLTDFVVDLGFSVGL